MSLLQRTPVRPRGGGTTSGRAGRRIYIFLAIVCLVGLFPFYWSFLIGSGDEFTVRDPHRSWIPGANFISNARAVIDNPSVNFMAALRNSIIVSGTVALSTVFFSTLAGFAFAKLRFKGRNGLLVFVIATTAVPWQLGLVPLFILMSKLGWTGTLGAVIVPSLVSAFGVFWMTQYISQALPDEIIEATRIDGANTFKAFWHVVLPVVRPAASMLGLFTFIVTWTDFFWPFIVLDQRNPTLPVSLQLLQSNYFVDYSIVLAGALLATLPLLALFVVTGKQLVSGIMQGAVKG
jgi:cellobiose transport system permease protein